jgi:polysaccharide biosynthesis transport protein
MSKISPSLSTLSALKRHYWAGLAVFASVLGAAVAYLAIAPRYYETSVRLIVQDNRVSVSDLGQLLANSAPPRDVNPIATQAELVESQRVIQRAIETFGKEKKIPKEELPSAAEIRGAMKVKIIPATSIVEVSYQYLDPEIAAGLLNAIARSMVVENTEAIRSEASAVREFLETQIPLQQDELKAAEAAERDYRRDKSLVSPETQTKSLVESLATLEGEERTLLAQLQEVATKNSLLQRVTKVNAPENAYTAVRVGQDEELKQLQSELTKLEVAILDNRSRLGDQHPDLLALMQKREELRRLYAQQLARVSSGGISAANNAPNELSQQMLSQYITGDIERRALDSRLRAVRAERVRLQNRVSQIPVLQQPLANLIRTREEAETTLKLLQSKLQEARIAEAQLAGNIQVVGYAEAPSSSASPKVSVVLVMAIAVGSVLAVGIILLLELANLALRNAGEAEELLELPVLSVLPKIPAKLSLEQFLNNPALVEPYRSLLRNVEACTSRKQQSVLEPQYSVAAVSTNNNHAAPAPRYLEPSTKQKPRVILVSSVSTGEGKSRVALLLSAVAAMLSRRTLVIDADLRNPVQHELLNLPAQPGLTEVADKSISLAQAVQPTDVENLFFLAHGQLLSRPSTLSESDSLKTILENAYADYDLIILDSPPASVCADAAALSRFSDGLVVVVRPNYTPRNLALQVVSELRKSDAPVVGTVMNETVGLEERNSSPYLVKNQKLFSSPVS